MMTKQFILDFLSSHKAELAEKYGVTTFMETDERLS